MFGVANRALTHYNLWVEFAPLSIVAFLQLSPLVFFFFNCSANFSHLLSIYSFTRWSPNSYISRQKGRRKMKNLTNNKWKKKTPAKTDISTQCRWSVLPQGKIEIYSKVFTIKFTLTWPSNHSNDWIFVLFSTKKSPLIVHEKKKVQWNLIITIRVFHRVVLWRGDVDMNVRAKSPNR